jgi:diacylglycerol kinase family enzyme
MPVKPLRFFFVINPISGGNDKAELVREAVAHFEQDGHIVRKFELQGQPDDCEEIKQVINEWHPDRVIAVGGDGTLKIVAEQLLGTKIPIGLIPAGSANGMAAELGITSDLPACLETIGQCNIQPLDAIIVNDKEVCLHLGDIGLNAQLVKEFEQSDRRGKWGYLKLIFGVIMRRKKLKLRIMADGKLYRRKAFMAILANARMYGMGTMVNPDGDLQDGKMEVVLVKQISLWELLKMLVKYKRFNPRKIEIIQAEEVKIISEKNAWFQVDGEYLGKVTEVYAYVQKHALQMILPQASE